ncbi:MAG TPA: glycosyltransferase [Candidatus Angelobacter sp.]
MNTAALYDLLAAERNDYDSLEKKYRDATGTELVDDPFNSPRGRLPLHVRTSVVIPAWNAADTIESCLRAIEISTLNRCYPDLLDVIVVDDGSCDGTWDLMTGLELAMNVLFVRQSHHSRAHAMNAGIASASGELIISCDADMLLGVFSLEELVRRYQVVGNAVFVGFRSDIEPMDARFTPSALVRCLPTIAPVFYGDNRVFFDRPGWPENMAAASDWFRNLGQGRRIWVLDGEDPMGDYWDLCRMVYGALFAIPQKDLEDIGGFNEEFVGWGWEDTAVAACTIAKGRKVVPIPAAVGFHVKHTERSKTQWEEAATNGRRFQQILDGSAAPRDNYLKTAQARIRERIERHPTLARDGVPDSWYACLSEALSTPLERANYWFILGKYERALLECLAADKNKDSRIQTLMKSIEGQSLRYLGDFRNSCDALAESIALQPQSTIPMVQLCLSLAAAGEFERAANTLRDASNLPESDTLGIYLANCSIPGHRKRAQAYLSSGNIPLARRDLEAVLIRMPDNLPARREWENIAER